MGVDLQSPLASCRTPYQSTKTHDMTTIVIFTGWYGRVPGRTRCNRMGRLFIMGGLFPLFLPKTGVHRIHVDTDAHVL